MHEENTEDNGSDKSLQIEPEFILNAIGEGVHGIDLDGRIVFENPASASMLGYEVDEMIGKPAHETIHHHRADELSPYPKDECPIYQSMQDGKVRRVRNETFWRKDGSSFPVNLIATPTRDVTGNIIGVTVAFTDITERNEVLAELEHERLRLAKIFEQSPNFIAVLKGPDYVFEFANTACRNLLGQALTGKPLREVLPDKQGSELIKTLDHVLTTGELRHIAVPAMIQRNAETEAEQIYVDLICQGRVEPDGSRSGVIVRGSDVTERRQAEDRVRFQAGLLDAVGEAVLATDREGQITYWNNAAEDLYGWSADEAMGRLLMDLILEQGHRSQAFEVLASTTQGNKWSGEFLVHHKDGTVFPVHVTTAPLLDARGEVIGHIGVSKDLTEQKAMEEKLQQSQRLEAIGRIAGGISHDFNNVLTTIQGNAELLKKDLQNDKAALHSVEEIDKAARGAAELTRQLLAFSRQQILRPQVISLSEVVSEMKGMLARVLREDIQLSVSTPEVEHVRADPTQMGQVILNLGTNARDAMPDGGTLSVHLDNIEVISGQKNAPDGVPPGRYVCLSVSDTGTGMDTNIKRQIWEPFFTTKPDASGTGLGLPSVYGIVMQSGGAITVDSEPGQGSTFKIYLPAVTGSSTSDGVQQVPDYQSPQTASATILVCDDQEAVRNITRRTLERAGHQVILAESGEQALAVIEQGDHRFDLLITDVVMPGINGAELVARIKEGWPRTKFILMSGYAGDDLGGTKPPDFDVPFLEKPFTSSTLLAMIDGILEPV